jgi:hypothetical protein
MILVNPVHLFLWSNKEIHLIWCFLSGWISQGDSFDLMFLLVRRFFGIFYPLKSGRQGRFSTPVGRVSFWQRRLVGKRNPTFPARLLCQKLRLGLSNTGCLPKSIFWQGTPISKSSGCPANSMPSRRRYRSAFTIIARDISAFRSSVEK